MARPNRARISSSRLFVSLFVLLCASNARRAAAAEVLIEWTAPAECPDHANIASRVEVALGGTATTNLTATVHLTRVAGGFRAELRITSSAGTGERALEHRDCEILAQSVALLIALSASGTPSTKQTKSRDHDLTFRISAHAAAVSGAVPGIGLGAGGAVALEGLWGLRLELNGTYYAKRTKTFRGTNIGAHFRLLRFGARICRVWSLGVLDLAPCAGAQLYRIHGAGFGGEQQTDDAAHIVAPTAGAFGRLQLSSHIGAFVAADGVVPASRRRFVYSDLGTLHRPAIVVFQGFVAFEVQF